MCFSSRDGCHLVIHPRCKKERMIVFFGGDGMRIDRLLGNFSIQMKILLFVVPLMAVIAIVATAGLVTSHLMQYRILLSNSVVQSLGDFKGLSDGMNNFLRAATSENRNAVTTSIQRQIEAFSLISSQVRPSGGSQEVDAARLKTESLLSKIDDLSALYQEEQQDRSNFNKDLRFLSGEQLKILNDATKLQRSVRMDESSAKALMRDADRLTNVAKTFNELLAKLEEQTGSQIDQTLLKNAADAAAILQRSGSAQVLSNVNLEVIVAELGVLSGAATTASPAFAPQQLNQALELAIGELDKTATAKMLQATQTFVKLEVPTNRLESLLNATRKLSNSVATVQTDAALFLNDTGQAAQQKLNKDLDNLARDIEAINSSEMGSQLIGSNFERLASTIQRLDAAGDAIVKLQAARESEFAGAAKIIGLVWEDLRHFADDQTVLATQDKQKADGISTATSVAGLLIALAAATALIFTLKQSIGKTVFAMRRLADGRLDATIDGQTRKDEIGDMARALNIFRENAISKERVETEACDQRLKAEKERRQRDTEKKLMDEKIHVAVELLGSGLGRLAKGDLSKRIETPFTDELEPLRLDFNETIERLRETVGEIQQASLAIHGGGSDLSVSITALSRRTECQAAALEQAAATVDEIATTVRMSAERAHDADVMVNQTKETAERSTTVVTDAVNAMGRIEKASCEIEQIIGVIEDLAFQTNLLALNAGIEAARAGDAGKGFAVVAQEVRALAQRSASSAHEIKSLIDKSTQEVRAGSSLVQDMGAVLSVISAQIVGVKDNVQSIARASRDQSASIGEVNSSVNEMDQMTQQNALMVEDSAGASIKLVEKASFLLQLMERFELDIELSGDQSRMVA